MVKWCTFLGHGTRQWSPLLGWVLRGNDLPSTMYLALNGYSFLTIWDGESYFVGFGTFCVLDLLGTITFPQIILKFS